MAEKPSSDLAEIVTCSICLERLKDARALPCLHSFCKDCLQGLLTSHKQITCPHCRLEVDVPDGDVSKLNPNFFVNSLLDVLNSKSEASLGVANVPARRVCATHTDKDCELFCKSCSKLICYHCIAKWGNCYDHSYEGCEEAAGVFRNNVEKCLGRGERCLPYVKNHVALLGDMKAKQSENFLGVSKEITDAFSRHIESLRGRQDTLAQEAFDLQSKNDWLISCEMDRIQVEHAKVENIIEFCHKILRVTDPVLFIQKYLDSQKVFLEPDFQELVSHVETDDLSFQGMDSMLKDVISNYGQVVKQKPGQVIKEEKPREERQKHGQQNEESQCARKLSSLQNKKSPSHELRSGNAPGSVSPALWKLYEKNGNNPQVHFGDNRLSVMSRSSRNVAVIGYPGFHSAQHSWKVKVEGFEAGFSVGVCVGRNSPGVCVTYNSAPNTSMTTYIINVSVDCEAQKVSVKSDGEHNANILYYGNQGLLVHPYFQLPPLNNNSKLTIVDMDGKALENTPDNCHII